MAPGSWQLDQWERSSIMVTEQYNARNWPILYLTCPPPLFLYLSLFISPSPPSHSLSPPPFALSLTLSLPASHRCTRELPAHGHGSRTFVLTHPNRVYFLCLVPFKTFLVTSVNSLHKTAIQLWKHC